MLPRIRLPRRAAVPRGVRGRAILLLGGIALLQLGAATTLTSASSTAPLSLTSDADSTPLSTAGGLAPGNPVTRCLRLSYGNAVSGDQLKLMASSSGALASHLHVRVDTGTGGDAASCAGFSGSPVYSGTLDALSSAHGTGPTALWLTTLPDGSSAITVRIRFSVDDTNTAQGTSATSDLVWLADALGDRTPPPPVVTPIPPPVIAPPPVTPPVVSPPAPPPAAPPAFVPPAVAPPAAPSPAAPSPADPGSGIPPSTTSPAGPVVPSAAPPPAVPNVSGPPVDGAGAPGGPVSSPSPDPAGTNKPSDGSDGGSGGIAQVKHVFSSGAKALSSGARAVASAAGDVAHVVGTQVIGPVAAAAAPVVRGASLGLGGTAPLLGAFLLIQGRIDRRDPKLALAPAYADPDLTFNDIPRGPLKSRTTDLTVGPEPEPGSEP